jgi:hypothetical protein
MNRTPSTLVSFPFKKKRKKKKIQFSGPYIYQVIVLHVYLISSININILLRQSIYITNYLGDYISVWRTSIFKFNNTDWVISFLNQKKHNNYYPINGQSQFNYLTLCFFLVIISFNSIHLAKELTSKIMYLGNNHICMTTQLENFLLLVVQIKQMPPIRS